MRSDPLTQAQIALVFELLLDRRPPDARIKTLAARNITLPQLRRMLMKSKEFRQKMASYTEAPAAAVPVPAQDKADRSGRIDRKQTTVVHLHIPKSAGTSLNIQLMAHYPEEARIDARAGSPHQQISALPPAERAKIGLVAGHCVHGLHRILPRKVLYLAVLRRPGPRLLSFYRFIQRMPAHPQHQLVLSKAPDFGRFLELSQTHSELQFEMDNGQVRRIAGAQPGLDIAQLYEVACRHLTAPDMIHGVVEHLDPFLQRLLDRGVLNKVRDVRANVDPGNSPASQGAAPAGESSFDRAYAALTPPQKDLLARCTQWDDRLYELAIRQDTLEEQTHDA